MLSETIIREPPRPFDTKAYFQGESMENTKTLLAIFVIVAVVLMMNYLCGVWITRHGKKSVSNK